MESDRNLLLKLWFSEVFGPCNPKALDFLKRFSFIEELYDNRYNSSVAKDLSPVELSRMHKLRLSDMETTLEYCEKHSVKILFYSDIDYPNRLREFEIPPTVIYVTGDSSVFDKKAIAGVGSRKPTRYGRDAVKEIIKPLAQNDFCLVSGLAEGIDSEVHKLAIENGAKTIAVLGCSIDQTYPKQNQEFRKLIELNGACVSEYPPKAGCSTFMFPLRNRIIAALSMGVIIFEAAKKSGTMITANYALSNSREVFAVPGSIFSKQSEGTNYLISLGAVPVSSATDVLNTFGICFDKQVDKDRKENKIQLENQTAKEIELSETERRIIEHLNDGAKIPDEMFEKLKVPMFEILASLSNLEIEGLIVALPGNKYSLKNMYE